MNQQDIVWIRFPFSNLAETKARPAVVVSRDEHNNDSEDVLICAVTSNLQADPYKIPVSSEDLVQGELPVDSMVRADKLIQVEKDLVDRTFARLDEETYDRVAETIHGLVRRKA